MPRTLISRTLIPTLAASILLSLAAPMHAEEDDLTDLARQLLSASGSDDLGRQVMEQMIGQMRQVAPPAVPTEFWDQVLARYDTGQLTEKIVPIYTQNLTADEMRAAIAFYKSEHGQTILQKMPTIMTESMMAGQEWGMGIAGEIMEEIEAMKEEATGEGSLAPEASPGS